MGLLDFDDEKILAERRVQTRGRYQRGEFQPEENFEALQNLNHSENSQDFEDSPFADRVPKKRDILDV